jgi:hypothetical protein
MSEGSVVIQVPASHLYRGLRLHAVCEAGAIPSVLGGQPDLGVLLIFEDGSYAAADLLVGEGGQVVLQVTAYTTAAGTSIPARMWAVKTIEEREDGLDIHLGSPFP